MNHTPLRIQRLTRELSEEMSVNYGTEEAARMLEQAATDIRKTAEQHSNPTADRASTLWFCGGQAGWKRPDLS